MGCPSPSRLAQPGSPPLPGLSVFALLQGVIATRLQVLCLEAPAEGFPIAKEQYLSIEGVDPALGSSYTQAPAQAGARHQPVCCTSLARQAASEQCKAPIAHLIALGSPQGGVLLARPPLLGLPVLPEHLLNGQRLHKPLP